MVIKYQPIGTIHSDHKTPQGTPIQSALAGNVKGYIDLNPDYVPGLRDLDGFSHLLLIYHFHLSRDWSLTVKPFLEDVEHGVFATRAPKRPNPIGLSVVRLERIEDNILHISDVDIVDGTPLLDIKPFAPPFDHRDNCSIGWMQGKIANSDRHHADERFCSHPSTGR